MALVRIKPAYKLTLHDEIRLLFQYSQDQHKTYKPIYKHIPCQPFKMARFAKKVDNFINAPS